jgi:hypothetical protein
MKHAFPFRVPHTVKLHKPITAYDICLEMNNRGFGNRIDSHRNWATDHFFPRENDGTSVACLAALPLRPMESRSALYGDSPRFAAGFGGAGDDGAVPRTPPPAFLLRASISDVKALLPPRQAGDAGQAAAAAGKSERCRCAACRASSTASSLLPGLLGTKGLASGPTLLLASSALSPKE